MTAPQDPYARPDAGDGPDADAPRPSPTGSAPEPAPEHPAAEPAPTPDPARERPDAEPGRPDAEPEVPVRDSGGPSASAWIALILGAIILVLLLIFVAQNSTVASFTYLGMAFEMQLGIATLLAAVVGALIAGIIGSVVIVRQGLQLRRMRREQDRIRRSLRR